jgi:hypothetical protein
MPDLTNTFPIPVHPTKKYMGAGGIRFSEVATASARRRITRRASGRLASRLAGRLLPSISENRPYTRLDE